MDDTKLLKLQALQYEKKTINNSTEKLPSNNYQFASFSPISLRKWRKAHPNPFRDGSIYSCF